MNVRQIFEDGRIGLKVAAILFLVLALFSTPLRPTYYYQRLQTTLLVLAQRCQIERIGGCDSHCTHVSSLFCITPYVWVDWLICGMIEGIPQ